MRAAILALILSGCSQPSEIALDYQLAGTIAPTDVVRVETIVSVDPSDPRQFTADQPYREVALGVGYEVRDLDGSGVRKILITQDSTVGYTFSPSFVFTLLPPTSESPPPLDVVATAHSATDKIGGSMQLTTKFAPGARVSVAIADDRCGAAACKNNRVCCSMNCVDPLTSDANCGGCGKKCGGGETCAGGVCQCAGGSACGTGESCCSVGCVDLAQDPFNCGTCGHACNPGETCSGGACKCGAGAACTGTGAACCDGVCSTTGCTCGVTTCTVPTTCCGTSCVDESNTNADCGGCGIICTPPLSCTNGACSCNGVKCVTGDACCASGCANLSNDPANCGGCAHACQSGETCANKQCLCGMTACAAGQTCCGSSCVDVTGDVNNCGSCGHACLPGETCAKGVCSCDGGGACTNAQTCCAQGPNGGPGGCFNLSNDPFHCGSCTQACPNGQGCFMGRCVTSSCQPACTNGNSCLNGVCSCGSGPACASPNTCCPPSAGTTGASAGGCFNLLSDVNNCGSCGKQCGPGEYCCNGNCTQGDKNNCGGCGISCGTLDKCCVCQTFAACILDTQTCACPAN